MDAPNQIIIDLSALATNYAQIKSLTGNQTRVMGVVKSDAYGHGLLSVSRLLEKKGIDFLGTAFVYEAFQLRQNSIKTPIVILSGIQNQEDARAVVEHNLTPVIYDLASAELLEAEAARQGKKVSVQIKVDTGMGRLGIAHEDVVDFLSKMIKLDHLSIKALTSHLSSADDCEDGFTTAQIKRFQKSVSAAREMGLSLSDNSLANSAGLLSRKDAFFQVARPGIAIYGGLPGPGFIAPLSLRPVMQFKGKILQTRELPGQTPVSYGRTFCTSGTCKMAVISAGYADGLFRSLSNRGKVLIHGQKVPIVGTICMNLTIADISQVKDVKKGDEAVFLGTQLGQTITCDDMAESAQTISYEVLCALGLGKKKEYVS